MIDRRTLEDCLTRIIGQANMAFGEELVVNLNRGGMSKRRAREVVEVLELRVFDWIEEIVRTANFEPTYDRPEGYTIFNGAENPAADARVEAKGRKKA